VAAADLCKLRVRHLNTKAYSPEAKGKIERFNGRWKNFLQEASLENPQTLDALTIYSGPGCRRGTITGYTPRYQGEPGSGF